ncbi:cilia- and flagella-associated protein 65, partial [Haematococcus lacustris]
DRAFILEQQIFQVKPRSGLLQPGGSAHITLAYKPAVKGSHQLPLFMHIADGKRLHVQLHGSTVQPPVQRLALTTTTRTFTFDPTPIGEEDPPRQ